MTVADKSARSCDSQVRTKELTQWIMEGEYRKTTASCQPDEGRPITKGLFSLQILSLLVVERSTGMLFTELGMKQRP